MRLVHENMLPALERCSVILSRFTGIAKFQGNNNTEGFSSHQTGLIMDTVACLHLVSSRILIHGVDELDTFSAFSSWLRYEIDRLASDPSNSGNEEISDKEALIDHSKVLRYLQSNMISSPLGVFFSEVTADDYNDWSHAEQGLPMFDILEKELGKQEQGLPYLKPLPRVELLCKYLTRQANTVFNQIAEAEKRNVLFGKAIELVKPQDGLPMDMRMSPKVSELLLSAILS
jgi:anaphase-promoting complex subunit 4